MGESGPSGGTPSTRGSGAADGGPWRTRVGPAAEHVNQWIGAWRSQLRGDTRIPEDEARSVVGAVLEDFAGGPPEALDRAGQAWGRAHRSVSAMIERLSALRQAMAAGAVDHPLEMHRALDRVTVAATEEALNRLEHASRTDALTGVGNRRAFDETLSAALSAAGRQGHQVTVVAVDLDGLKRINDTEGHAAGDAALLALVRAFYSALRDEDTVFRVGGDEFVILLPFTSVDAAQSLMLRIQGAGAPEFTWGAAGFPGAGAEAAALVEAADQDLYRRRQGRRRLGAAIATRRVVHLGPRRVQRLWRWAWIPAAAVLVASMVATFVTSGTAGPFASATRGGHRASPASYPAGAAPAAGTGRGSGTTSPSSPGGVQAAELGYESSVGNTGSAGAPTSSPPGSAPPGPLAPGSSGGGILGTLQQAVAPVPVVGGGNGLLAKLTQLLSPTPASAGSSDRSPTPGVLSLAQPFGF